MGSVHFLNLEYLITRTFEPIATFFGAPGSGAAGTGAATSSPAAAAATEVAHGAATALEAVIIAGMVLSLILLILVVYYQIRLMQVEHEGFHALEEEEYAARERGPEGEAQGSTRWGDIVALSTSPSESDWRRAILEADIMLGDVLSERGFEGLTVADQLRAANPFQMTTLEAAWDAHKVRNRVAHEGERLDLTERDVRAAIDNYKRVFEEFGAI